MAIYDSSGVHRLQADPAAERVIALARNAHRTIDQRDEIDYWFRLGQRNAYAHAAGIVIARGVDSAAFAVAECLTAALEEGVTDLAALQSTAFGEASAAGAAHRRTWLEPMAFKSQFGTRPGIDHDYGMRWGTAGEQRISLRHPVAGDRGLLYAYDPTWDEYTILAGDADVSAVRAAFAQAIGTNIHMSVSDFAALVAQHETTLTLQLQRRGPEL